MNTELGQFESVGAVLDILPFAANGSATWSGTSRLRFDASFHVQNGIISLKREDCRTSFDLTKQTNLTVSDFRDHAIPANLMDQFSSLAKNQIVSRLWNSLGIPFL